jgi:uncharacterized protein with von Willebrand factor type A (vWA) domain
MEELLKLMVASGLKDFEKQMSNDNVKKVDISKIKEQMSQKAIDEAASQIKKMYDAFVKAGFNEVQAFELIKVNLSSMRISR